MLCVGGSANALRILGRAFLSRFAVMWNFDFETRPRSPVGREVWCLSLAQRYLFDGARCLEIGSGVGWFAIELARQNSNVEVFAFEPNADSLQKAIQRESRSGTSGTGLQRVRWSSTALDEHHYNSFDIIFCWEVLEHITPGTEISFLQNLRRYLKKGGRVLLSTPNSDWVANLCDPAWYFGHRHYSKEQLQSCFLDAGFDVSRVWTRGRSGEIAWIANLYISKWIFHSKPILENWFRRRLDDEYMSEGFNTLFIEAIA